MKQIRRVTTLTNMESFRQKSFEHYLSCLEQYSLKYNQKILKRLAVFALDIEINNFSESGDFIIYKNQLDNLLDNKLITIDILNDVFGLEIVKLGIKQIEGTSYKIKAPIGEIIKVYKQMPLETRVFGTKEFKPLHEIQKNSSLVTISDHNLKMMKKKYPNDFNRVIKNISSYTFSGYEKLWAVENKVISKKYNRTYTLINILPKEFRKVFFKNEIDIVNSVGAVLYNFTKKYFYNLDKSGILWKDFELSNEEFIQWCRKADHFRKTFSERSGIDINEAKVMLISLGNGGKPYNKLREAFKNAKITEQQMNYGLGILKRLKNSISEAQNYVLKIKSKKREKNDKAWWYKIYTEIENEMRSVLIQSIKKHLVFGEKFEQVHDAILLNVSEEKTLEIKKEIYKNFSKLGFSIILK